MMPASDDKSIPDQSRAAALGLNRSEHPKLDPAEQSRVAGRNRLIVQVMEVNEKQRHYESIYLGVKLELDHARRAAASGNQESAEQASMISELDRKYKDLTGVLEKLVAERDFLEVALAEIDGAPLPKTVLPGRGRA